MEAPSSVRSAGERADVGYGQTVAGQTLRSWMYSSAHAIIKRVTSVCSGMRYLRAEAAVRLGTLTIGQV